MYSVSIIKGDYVLHFPKSNISLHNIWLKKKYVGDACSNKHQGCSLGTHTFHITCVRVRLALADFPILWTSTVFYNPILTLIILELAELVQTHRLGIWSHKTVPTSDANCRFQGIICKSDRQGMSREGTGPMTSFSLNFIICYQGSPAQ